MTSFYSRRLICAILVLCMAVVMVSSTMAISWGVPDPDPHPAQISDVSIDKQGQTLKPGDTFTVKCKASDVETVSRVSCTFEHTESDRHVFASSVDRYNSETGYYEISFRVESTTQIRKWYISRIRVDDGKSRSTYMEFAPNSGHWINVEGGIDDLVPPSISDVHLDKQGQTLSPGEEFKLSSRIYDASGVSDAACGFKLDNGNYSLNGYNSVYNRSTGLEEFTFRIPLAAKNGTYRLIGLVASDIYYNDANFDCANANIWLEINNPNLLKIDVFPLKKDTEETFYHTATSNTIEATANDTAYYAARLMIPSIAQFNSGYSRFEPVNEKSKITVSFRSTNLDVRNTDAKSFKQDIFFKSEPQVLWFDGSTFTPAIADISITDCGCDLAHICSAVIKEQKIGDTVRIYSSIRFDLALQTNNTLENLRIGGIYATAKNERIIEDSGSTVCLKGYDFTAADSSYKIFLSTNTAGKVKNAYICAPNAPRKEYMICLNGNYWGGRYPIYHGQSTSLFGWTNSDTRAPNSLITRKTTQAADGSTPYNYYNFGNARCVIGSDGKITPAYAQINKQDWQDFIAEYNFQGEAIQEADCDYLYFFNESTNKYQIVDKVFWDEVLRDTDGKIYYKINRSEPPNPIIVSDGFAERTESVYDSFSNTFVCKTMTDGTAFNRMKSVDIVNNDTPDKALLYEFNRFFRTIGFNFRDVAAGNVYITDDILRANFVVKDQSLYANAYWVSSSKTDNPSTGANMTNGDYSAMQYYMTANDGHGILQLDGGLQFVIDADHNKQTGASCDGNPLQRDVDYSVSEGSTIFTLSPNYLSSLSEGTHLLRVYFTDGYSEMTFSTPLSSVSAITSVPATGSHNYLVMPCMLLALLGLYGIRRYRKDT